MKKQVQIKVQFELIEQCKDESIHEYFSRMDKLVNEMKNNIYNITEKEAMEKIMLQDNCNESKMKRAI